MRTNLDSIDLEVIYEFMERGSVDNAPVEIVEYLELLDKVRGMIIRIDKYGSKDAIVKHLMVSDKLSRYKASQVYDETIEYFYHSTRVSKEAWRNIYAEKMEKMLNFSLQIAETVDDARKIVQMIKDIADMRQVHKDDVKEFSQEDLKAPMILYSINPEDLGMPKANRNKLAEMIDSLPELTEKEKIRIKQETQAIPLKVFPDESENPRKS